MNIISTVLKNILEITFPPTVSEAIYSSLSNAEDLTGKAPTAQVLTDETAISLAFGTNPFQAITTGAENITVNADLTGLKAGQRVFLRVTQGATPRTITWGTGIKSAVTITATGAKTDMLVGVFDGTRIMLGAITQNLTL